MKIIYTIKNAPDPINPNEQATGTVLVDDRLYGKDIFSIGIDAQAYTSDWFSKPTNSNTLTLANGLTFNPNTIVNLETCE